MHQRLPDRNRAGRFARRSGRPEAWRRPSATDFWHLDEFCDTVRDCSRKEKDDWSKTIRRSPPPSSAARLLKEASRFSAWSLEPGTAGPFLDPEPDARRSLF